MKLRFEVVDGVRWNVARGDDGHEAWTCTTHDGRVLLGRSRQPLAQTRQTVRRYLAGLPPEERAQIATEADFREGERLVAESAARIGPSTDEAFGD